jgi:hypothetical protein
MTPGFLVCGLRSEGSGELLFFVLNTQYCLLLTTYCLLHFYLFLWSFILLKAESLMADGWRAFGTRLAVCGDPVNCFSLCWIPITILLTAYSLLPTAYFLQPDITACSSLCPLPSAFPEGIYHRGDSHRSRLEAWWWGDLSHPVVASFWSEWGWYSDGDHHRVDSGYEKVFSWILMVV